MKKDYGYTVIFSNGLANSGNNVKAESERDVIMDILNDHFIADQTIVSITVVEQHRENTYLVGGTQGEKYATVFVQAKSMDQAIEIGEKEHNLKGCQVVDWDGKR